MTFTVLEESLWAKSGILVHESKTQFWNAGESTWSREVAQRFLLAITSSRHQSVRHTSWPPGFCARPLGNAQRTSSHIAGAHAHWCHGICTTRWEAIVGAPLREPNHFEPGTVRFGWQQEASARVEERYRGDLFTAAGTGASRCWTTIPPTSSACVVSDRFSPCLRATSDAAVHLTLSLCAGGSVGPAWLRFGECGCKDVPGGRRTSPHHVGEGHGFGRADRGCAKTKWLWMVCRCREEPNLQWTRRRSVPCTQTVGDGTLVDKFAHAIGWPWNLERSQDGACGLLGILGGCAGNALPQVPRLD